MTINYQYFWIPFAQNIISVPILTLVKGKSSFCKIDKVKFKNSNPFSNDQLTTLEEAQMPGLSLKEGARPKVQYKTQEIPGWEGN